MQAVCIGKIVNTHGLKGEVKIESYSDFDEERYEKGKTVYIGKNGQMIPVVCSSFRIHRGCPLVSFRDLQDINLVETYKNCLVYVDKESRMPLKEGEYYQTDLIGLDAYDEEGNSLGKVLEVEPTCGAQNNLRIGDDRRTFLVPYVPQFILKVDLPDHRIVIHRDEGLL